jgi:hypothetical protein
MLNRIICGFILFSSVVFAQYSTVYGNLIRIPFDATQINPSDTMGNWVSYNNSNGNGFTKYRDVLYSPQSVYFEKYKQDDYTNFGLITDLSLEEFENHTSDSYGNWMGYYDITEPYLILDTYPYRVENGTWLINGMYNMAFLSDDDKITILPKEYYHDMVYICTKINDKYLSVFRKNTSEPSYDFYLLDLSASPDFDTTGAVKVFFDQPAAPYKMRNLMDSLYIAGIDILPYSGHKLNLYMLENNTFHFIKTFIDDYFTENWEYRDSTLYLLNGNSLAALRYYPNDTSFIPTGVVLPLGSNYAVNRDLSIAVRIQGDTSLEIFNPGLINTIDISKIKNPEFPFIDSPYVYIHQITLITGIIDENPRPSGYDLQVFPNPFNPSANVIYTLPERSNVEIKLFDMLGREVKNLYGGMSDAGSHKLIINGSGLASGIYLVRFQTRNYSKALKVILLK